MGSPAESYLWSEGLISQEARIIVRRDLFITGKTKNVEARLLASLIVRNAVRYFYEFRFAESDWITNWL